MSNNESEAISDEELFENSFFYFVDSLDALASPAEVACEKYGHFNVAWEIKVDVSSGVYLAESPANRLSEQQISDIQELVDALSLLPESILHFTKIIEESLENMQHPAWAPVRKKASMLLESLRPLIEVNKRYFLRSPDAP